MPQRPQDDTGHWIYVPPDRPKEPAPKSSAAGLALFFVGVLLLSHAAIGLRGIQAVQRLMHRYNAQIEATQKQ